ncbi:MAG TPA: hypothetical protein VF992_03540 [Thermoplasmata archaeon]
MRADLIRLGPSSVTLPEGAVQVSATWYRQSDGDSAYDYYTFWVHIENRVNSDSIVPYAIEVNISTRGGQTLGGWLPMGGDHGRMERFEWLLDGSSPQTIALELPAGYVNWDDGGAYFTWSVQGERGLASQAIFQGSADFLLNSVRFAENATMEAHVDALLIWCYATPFQAYPVASRGETATCLYIPDPGSEGSTPYSACG